MKVLLVVTSYENAFPFIQDLEYNLKNQKLEVDILDIGNLNIRKHNGESINILHFSRFRKILDVRKLGTLLKVLILKIYLSNLKGSYDAVNIHSCEHIYSFIIKSLKGLSNNLSVMIWGSDFYRISNKARENIKIIFQKCDYIMFANSVNAQDFLDYYKEFKEKAIIVGFGVTKFQLIEKIVQNEPIDILKTNFALPKDKIIIACGYNGRPGQQHILLLDQLKALPKKYKERVFILIQMSYGFEDKYYNEVTAAAENAGINFKILTQFLTDKDIARLRLVSDILINAQITDGFSSSIQEHIYANNIVIVGEWLPYEPLNTAGIVYYKAQVNNFENVLRNVLDNFQVIRENVKKNREKIQSISSWAVKTPKWIDAYKGEVENLKYREDRIC